MPPRTAWDTAMSPPPAKKARRSTRNLAAKVFFAACTGRTDELIALIDLGADPNEASADGKTLLHKAAQHGHNQTVAALLQRGADMDPVTHDNNMTPLYLAAHQGHARVVETLVAAGADLDTSWKCAHCDCDNRRTPCDAAFSSDHLDIALRLIELGACAHYDTVDQVVMPAICEDESHKIAKRLTRGKTLLHHATQRWDWWAVCTLLLHGADIDQRVQSPGMPRGATALHIAAKAFEQKKVLLLLRFNPDATIRNAEGQTPGMHAIACGNYTAAKCILLYETGEPERVWSAYDWRASQHTDRLRKLLTERSEDGETPFAQLLASLAVHGRTDDGNDLAHAMHDMGAGVVWSKRRHMLCPKSVRIAAQARTVFLGGRGASAPCGGRAPYVPKELWRNIFGFLLDGEHTFAKSELRQWLSCVDAR